MGTAAQNQAGGFGEQTLDHAATRYPRCLFLNRGFHVCRHGMRATIGRCPIGTARRMIVVTFTSGPPIPHLDASMKLYVTYTSPYARLARIVVAEKALHNRVEIIEARTRTPGSPYYLINPSGRVPYLVDDAGVGMEDSQLICAYLDNLDGNPRFHGLAFEGWEYRRLEAVARSMCDGISVWAREMSRPANERSPTVLAHEVAR